jgi:hypothetical protein
MQIHLCLGKNGRWNLSVKSMQNSKIVVNIIFWSQNYGKLTDGYIYMYIQGVTGGMCETSGEFSLGQTIPI